MYGEDRYRYIDILIGIVDMVEGTVYSQWVSLDRLCEIAS